MMSLLLFLLHYSLFLNCDFDDFFFYEVRSFFDD